MTEPLTKTTPSVKIKTTQDNWYAVPLPDEPTDLNSVVYNFRVNVDRLNIDQFSLTPEGVEQLRSQLNLPTTFSGQASIFGGQFLADMNSLRREHPAIFYGGLLLAAGALFIIFWPALSAFPLLTLGGFTLTAGVATKGTLFFMGGLGIYNSLSRYQEVDDMKPTTPIGRYLIEREKIVQKGTAITLGAGMVILGGETAFMIRFPQYGRTGLLATCLAICHPDELAMIFGNSEKAAHFFSENSSYVCQHDEVLGELACVEEGLVQIDTLRVQNTYRTSVPLDPRFRIE